jgi:RNA polymerase sigma-70 factor (ECF subfamily)
MMSVIEQMWGWPRLTKELESKRERLYRIAFSWCHDSSLADDLTQEAMAKALQRSSQLRDDKKAEAWLLQILSNCWRDHLRRARDVHSVDDYVLFHTDTPERAFGASEMVARVRHAISVLPMGQRQVLTLVDISGASYLEAADILDVPVGTVMSRLSRARRVLKQSLRQVGEESGSEPAPARVSRVLRRVK